MGICGAQSTENCILLCLHQCQSSPRSERYQGDWIKFDVYESILQVPHYIVFNKRGDRLRYFRLVNGRYEEQAIGPQNPRLWIPALEIGLALWSGEFRSIPRSWLRWCDAKGELIPTDAEAAQ